MKFNHEESWEWFESILQSKLSAKEAWSTFIDYHEKIAPQVNWNTLKNIDVESELIQIKDWFEQLVISNPIPEKTVALWIGLFKVEYENNDIPTIYVVGADTFNNDDIEWACDPTYVPENRYAQPTLLKELDDAIKTDEEHYEFLDWILPLACTAFIIDEIIHSAIRKSVFLDNRNKMFVTVGYDSGDYINVSCIE
ncbi:MAG: hypothetical protein JNJ85_11725 [Candidatus Kapabacteria bacterium]|nr:hypothetical protein [Candidatus Kapabacteria bacterium]